MNLKSNKPKQTAKQLIQKMKEDKGIQFKYISAEDAESYLDNHNNYLRTTSYRKNYPKHTKGIHRGKYIGLDFSYLKELSIIDMHFRFLLFKMCSDLEHSLKVQMLKDIEYDNSTDGYDIVVSFLSQHSYIINKLEKTINSPFTKDLFLN